MYYAYIFLFGVISLRYASIWNVSGRGRVKAPVKKKEFSFYLPVKLLKTVANIYLNIGHQYVNLIKIS